MPPGRANARRSPSDRARPVPHPRCAMPARCRQPAMLSTPRVAAWSPGEATLGGRAASTGRVPVCAPPAGTAGRVLVSLHIGERALTGTPHSSDTSPGRLLAPPLSSSLIRSSRVVGGATACHSFCHSIGRKRVGTGSHGLYESVLFGLLTHQLKATGRNGLDGSDHPLKVKTRVRTPYGLPARNPRSTATFRCDYVRTGGGGCHSLCHSIGTDSVRAQQHVRDGSTPCAGAMLLVALVVTPRTDRNTSRMWCHSALTPGD